MPSKRFSRDRATCKVTFTLPATVGAATAQLCGDFNDWNPDSEPMKRAKDGSFKLVMTLPAQHTYRYRFLLDGARWENDWDADRYEPNEFGEDDSVLEL